MYCDFCHHPLGYHGNKGCSMPVIVGTFEPKGRDNRPTQQCPCPGRLHTYVIKEEEAL